jgi:hypothetical protein
MNSEIQYLSGNIVQVGTDRGAATPKICRDRAYCCWGADPRVVVSTLRKGRREGEIDG